MSDNFTGPRMGNHFSGANPVSPNQQKGPNSLPNNTSPNETAEFASAYLSGRANNRQSSGKPSNPSVKQARTAPSSYRQEASPAGHVGQQPKTRTIDSSNFQPPKKKGKGKIIAGVIGAIVAVLVVAGGIWGFSLYSDAKTIMSKVDEISAQADTIKDAVSSSDTAKLTSTAETIANQVSNMHAMTDGFNWQLASFIPVLGQDVTSARTIVAEADKLCQNALIPGVASLASVQTGSVFVDGAINIDLLQSLIDTLQSVAPEIKTSAETINSLPEARIGKVGDAINKVRNLMGTAGNALDQINEIAPYLPQMLGADSQRSYLLVAQNNAEIRSVGGFAGSAAILNIDNGRLSLGDFHALNGEMSTYDDPTHLATQDEISIFQTRVGAKPWDANFIVDFSRVAEIYSTAWSEQYGDSIDGVIAIDPIFLQSLLKVIGGVNTSAGITVDGTNAVRLLQHDVYSMLDTNLQDSFFSEVASAAFEKVVSGLGDISTVELIQTAMNGIESRNVLCWMSNDDEQQVMVKLGCSGTLANDPTEPVLGVYLSDDTISKMGWYLSTSTEILSETNNSDGSISYEMSTSVTNNITLDEASSITDYITGYSTNKHTVDDMLDWVYLVAPAGGSISNVQSNGTVDTEFPAIYNGFEMWACLFHTGAQQTSTITYTITTSSEASEPLQIVQTPTLQEIAGWR